MAEKDNRDKLADNNLSVQHELMNDILRNKGSIEYVLGRNAKKLFEELEKQWRTHQRQHMSTPSSEFDALPCPMTKELIDKLWDFLKNMDGNWDRIDTQISGYMNENKLKQDILNKLK